MRTPTFSNVAQWETSDTLVEATTLPSFLYLPEDALAEQLRGRVPETPGMDCRPARTSPSGEIPGRVVRSAKSWLCHHAADRSAPILPWGSEDLAPANKDFSRSGRCFHPELSSGASGTVASRPMAMHFDDQEVTVTVPASFDAAAQRLTLSRSRGGRISRVACTCSRSHRQRSTAGSNSTACLIRCGRDWAMPGRGTFWWSISAAALRISVCSSCVQPLRAASPTSRASLSANISCWVETISTWPSRSYLNRGCAGERGRISGPQWDHLVASCRDIKEQALSGDALAGSAFMVALPGRGSSLVGGSTDRRRWRETRSSGWCSMASFQRATRVRGLIGPRQVCAIGDFPTRPTAR